MEKRRAKENGMRIISEFDDGIWKSITNHVLSWNPDASWSANGIWCQPLYRAPRRQANVSWYRYYRKFAITLSIITLCSPEHSLSQTYWIISFFNSHINCSLDHCNLFIKRTCENRSNLLTRFNSDRKIKIFHLRNIYLHQIVGSYKSQRISISITTIDFVIRIWQWWQCALHTFAYTFLLNSICPTISRSHEATAFNRLAGDEHDRAPRSFV